MLHASRLLRMITVHYCRKWPVLPVAGGVSSIARITLNGKTSACLIREAGVSEANANLVYVCDQWEIDLGRRELRSSGIAVPLGGRAFEVVTVLVQSASEFVTKDRMMERVWPGATVGEGTLHVHISAVRKALGADRAMLKTASGRGYRLLGSWTPQQREATAAPVYSPLPRTSGAPPANNFPPAHHSPDRSGRSCAVCPRPRLCLSGSDLDGPRRHREDLPGHQSRPLPPPRL